jgi:beta-glucosidase
MKKLLKILLYSICSILGLIILIALITVLWISISGNHTAKKNMALESPEVKTLTIDGFTFRDLNKNGKLDPYEDKRQPGEVRINDLLSQMNLEEKAGTMFITMINMKKDGSVSEKPFLGDFFSFFVPGTSQMLFGKKLNHFNILSAAGKKQTAEWYNHIQKLA